MTDTIYLGSIEGTGKVYLSKHSWDCEWYWGFGYLGNRNCHFHISSLIDTPADNSHPTNWYDPQLHFDTTWINQEQWWILRDLFIQAYAFKAASAAYRSGGHQTEDAAPHRIKSKYMEDQINEDLETLLNTIWNLLHEWKGED